MNEAIDWIHFFSLSVEASTEADKELDKKRVTFASEAKFDKVPDIAQIEPAEDEYPDWRKSCPIGIDGETKRIDMKVIEPYKKVLSHAGYHESSYESSFSSDQEDSKSRILPLFD